jgi:hypothetical protein
VGGPLLRGEDEGEAESEIEGEEFAGRVVAGLGRRLHRRLRRWVLPALVRWIRTRGEEFARAAAAPQSGVTVLVSIQVPRGISLLGRRHIGTLRATPETAVRAVPGWRRP